VRRRVLPALAVGAVAVAVPSGATAQVGWQLRLDARLQRVAYEGLAEDSLLAGDVVQLPNGAFETPDGIAAYCQGLGVYCYYYRPGPALASTPTVGTANLRMWGLGIAGLTAVAEVRAATDLSDAGAAQWPGLEPAVQLFEGYLDYASRHVGVRAGRQIVNYRLGWTGFDGGRVSARIPSAHLEAMAFAGWGFGQATALPITSSALNPLDDFRPGDRTVVAGGVVSYASPTVDARAEYLREVEVQSNKFAQERVAVSGTVRAGRHVQVTGGTEYDLAYGWWGTSDLSVRYFSRDVAVTAGARQYRPSFELWTIWGAFSPVAWKGVNGSVAVSLLRQKLQLRARGELYEFDEDGANNVLTPTERDGYRVSGGVTGRPIPTLTIDVGVHRDQGVGARSNGFDSYVTWTPLPTVTLSARAAKLFRPLEFRFSDATVWWYGGDAQVRPAEWLRLGLDIARYDESRDRPDNAAFDFDQTRIAARVSLLFNSSANRLALPPAVRRRPAGR